MGIRTHTLAWWEEKDERRTHTVVFLMIFFILSFASFISGRCSNWKLWKLGSGKYPCSFWIDMAFVLGFHVAFAFWGWDAKEYT
ncbi:hypothetical protein M011DRAFT_157494 [Sporormia fimetaria CBS 119925]|uniref:Uncharacterized protein n=1 Tax=Sporormia fimetaria CBS 119925 TaxID=1340428 RepID=A0A6A6V4X3_9PLEO|nr:hypothetical protein M011DRAFT_157494 [Sporormia fimetaria CBS 119925]